MDSAAPISLKLKKILRWIEWTVLFDCVVTNFLSGALSFIPYAHLRIVVCLTVLGGFSLRLLPTELSLNQRRAYILTGFVLLAFVDMARVNHSVLLDLVIIKACLLLPRQEAILVTVLAVSAMFAQNIWQLPLRIEEAREITIEPYLNFHKIFWNSLVGRVTGTLFVLLLGFVFVAAQRSRYRAEKLALEVEALATKLERSRIARDIHDSLGHSLTTLDVQLALVDRYAQTDQDKPKLHQAIKTSQQLATQCLTEARQSLQTMRSPNFDLATAIETLSAEMHPFFAVALSVQVPPLPQQLGYQLYLIAKEGLVNVKKHAEATHVELSIVAKDEQIVLSVIDDGCGFEGEVPGQGYGVQGMRERSQLLGGRLTIHRHNAGGTQLQVTVPRPVTTATTCES